MKAKSKANHPNLIRQINKVAAFDAVRLNKGGLSRADVARHTQLSRATVSALVDELIGSGLLREARVGASKGGRRPTILELNADASRVVGIDVGATHLTAAVANLSGKSLALEETPFDVTAGPEAGLKQVYQVVERIVARAESNFDSISAIVVGVPGPVVSRLATVVSPPIMPGWSDFPIQTRLQEKWGRPVYVDNDADLGALGEWAFGAARGEASLAYIKVGTGIGCGILIDGQIYRGVSGTAGEIGHLTISEDGPPCKCGNYGCLEAMAGGRAIAERAHLAIKAGQSTSLASNPTDFAHTITARDVAIAAKAGDRVSQQLLSDAGRHIGSAITSLINLLDPGLVLVGGGVTGAGDFLINAIRSAVNDRGSRAGLRGSRVEVAALGSQSIVMGAVARGLNETFRTSIEGA